jgi:AraC family transcriptional regulator
MIESKEGSSTSKRRKECTSMQIDQNLVTTLEAPRFEDGKPQLIAGLRERLTGDPGTIPGLWQRFGPYIGNLPGQVGRVAYGVCLFKGGGNLDCESYLAGVEVSDFSGLPTELSQVRIPGHKYVVFPHREHVSRLWNTFYTIGQQWLPESGYEVANAPAFLERYGEDFNPRTGTGDIEVWIPIKA